VLWQEEHEKQCCSPVPALSLFPKLWLAAFWSRPHVFQSVDHTCMSVAGSKYSAHFLGSPVDGRSAHSACAQSLSALDAKIGRQNLHSICRVTL
jgi:hypothetical protein